ncbi:hypothetical protein CEXT_524981 [Caerostris extrusa]|uniref:Uncharacterized protein n=1 Tax=Caerostris extrusa TaxID=172846 RepID=A0AAV4SLD8_CAEEX|nr:hypothetical protein CEXT_524981 [Caerostris extrusa]
MSEMPLQLIRKLMEPCKGTAIVGRVKELMRTTPAHYTTSMPKGISAVHRTIGFKFRQPVLLFSHPLYSSMGNTCIGITNASSTVLVFGIYYNINFYNGIITSKTCKKIL